jgi:hypothetical protein
MVSIDYWNLIRIITAFFEKIAILYFGAHFESARFSSRNTHSEGTAGWWINIKNTEYECNRWGVRACTRTYMNTNTPTYIIAITTFSYSEAVKTCTPVGISVTIHSYSYRLSIWKNINFVWNRFVCFKNSKRDDRGYLVLSLSSIQVVDITW